MRTLIVCAIVSLDGYVEGPDKNVMALPFDEAFDEYNAARLRVADTLLLGRNTFEGFASYWPPIAQRADVRPVEREISRLNTAMTKVVISDSLSEGAGDAWASTTRIVRRADAHQAVAALKEQDGGDILVFGSGTMWNDLLAAGLVDEIHLMIGPALLGSGTSVFIGSGPVPLRLIESRTLDNSQLVLARYDARRSG